LILTVASINTISLGLIWGFGIHPFFKRSPIVGRSCSIVAVICGLITLALAVDILGSMKEEALLAEYLVAIWTPRLLVGVSFIISGIFWLE